MILIGYDLRILFGEQKLNLIIIHILKPLDVTSVENLISTVSQIEKSSPHPVSDEHVEGNLI